MSFRFIAAIGGLALLAVQGAARPMYTIRALESIPTGWGSWANDINNQGQVVGFTPDDFGEYRALLWQPDGAVVNLGGTGPHSSKAYGISEGGLVVGYSDARTGRGEPVVWNGTAMQFLPVLPGDIGGTAYDANDSGVIYGTSYNATGDSAPVVWINGVVQAVGPRHSWAFGVGPKTLGIGRIRTTSWPESVLFTPTGYTILPGLGGDSPYVYDINEHGVALGIAVNPATNNYHAVMWRDGQVEDKGLVMPGSRGVYAYGMNNREDFVGEYFPPQGSYRPYAFINGVGVELLDVTQGLENWVELNDVYDINDHGVIIGQGYRTGLWFDWAFVLVPRAPIRIGR